MTPMTCQKDITNLICKLKEIGISNPEERRMSPLLKDLEQPNLINNTGGIQPFKFMLCEL